MYLSGASMAAYFSCFAWTPFHNLQVVVAVRWKRNTELLGDVYDHADLALDIAYRRKSSRIGTECIQIKI